MYRLSRLLVDSGVDCTVLDAYPDGHKIIYSGVQHVAFSGPLRWFRLAHVIRRANRTIRPVIHLHFARPTGRFLLLSALCVRRRHLFFLTLHSGDQSGRWSAASRFARAAARAALCRVSKLIALSSQQMNFYCSLGIPAARLDRWTSSLPSGITPDRRHLPAEILNIRAVEDGGTASILVTSGYPEDIYGYEWCVELLDRLIERFEACLVVCLYGQGADPDYEQALRLRLATHAHVHVLGQMLPEGFLALLSSASVYLRPTREDSYGLAISDALDVGTPALASDVCERDPRCITFPKADKMEFFSNATQLVERGRAHGRQPRHALLEDSELYLSRYTAPMQC